MISMMTSGMMLLLLLLLLMMMMTMMIMIMMMTRTIAVAAWNPSGIVDTKLLVQPKRSRGRPLTTWKAADRWNWSAA